MVAPLIWGALAIGAIAVSRRSKAPSATIPNPSKSSVEKPVGTAVFNVGGSSYKSSTSSNGGVTGMPSQQYPDSFYIPNERSNYGAAGGSLGPVTRILGTIADLINNNSSHADPTLVSAYADAKANNYTVPGSDYTDSNGIGSVIGLPSIHTVTARAPADSTPDVSIPRGVPDPHFSDASHPAYQSSTSSTSGTLAGSSVGSMAGVYGTSPSSGGSIGAALGGSIDSSPSTSSSSESGSSESSSGT